MSLHRIKLLIATTTLTEYQTLEHDTRVSKGQEGSTRVNMGQQGSTRVNIHILHDYM